MSYRIINDILEAQVAAISDFIQIISENETITRTSSSSVGVHTVPYCKTTLLPAQTENLSLGDGGFDKFHGLFQIDLFYPTNNGTDGTNYKVDQIITAFPKGSLITSNGVTLRIRNHWRESSLEGSNWYQTPVIIQWESFLQR